eukprot:8300451-Pyramimonas_sp.AAC.1
MLLDGPRRRNNAHVRAMPRPKDGVGAAVSRASPGPGGREPRGRRAVKRARRPGPERGGAEGPRP